MRAGPSEPRLTRSLSGRREQEAATAADNIVRPCLPRPACTWEMLAQPAICKKGRLGSRTWLAFVPLQSDVLLASAYDHHMRYPDQLGVPAAQIIMGEPVGPQVSECAHRQMAVPLLSAHTGVHMSRLRLHCRPMQPHSRTGALVHQQLCQPACLGQRSPPPRPDASWSPPWQQWAAAQRPRLLQDARLHAAQLQLLRPRLRKAGSTCAATRPHRQRRRPSSHAAVQTAAG